MGSPHRTATEQVPTALAMCTFKAVSPIHDRIFRRHVQALAGDQDHVRRRLLAFHVVIAGDNFDQARDYRSCLSSRSMLTPAHS